MHIIVLLLHRHKTNNALKLQIMEKIISISSVFAKVSEICQFYGYSYENVDGISAFAIVGADIITSTLINELSGLDNVHFLSVSVTSGSLRAYFEVY